LFVNNTLLNKRTEEMRKSYNIFTG